MIGMFRKGYTLRRFGEQKIIRGHVSHPYTEMEVLLNIQPLSADELALLPEGQRTTKRIKAFGSEMLRAASIEEKVVGDRVLYHGEWYECTSSVIWEHTPLAHCESQFVICSKKSNDQSENNKSNESDGDTG